MFSSSYDLPHDNWKPILPNGITSTHIRPFTNKDYTNTYPSPFGKPRPLKQYRKGVIPYPDTNHRMVMSSVSQPLNGGLGLISQVQDVPGNYQVNDITTDPCNGTCNGKQIIHAYHPQEGSLTNNPQPLITVTKEFCCNEEQKALKRVLYANQTGHAENYYPDYNGYLTNRCRTFDKHEFNFVEKSPAGVNAYVMDCQPYNGTGCKLTIYKPSNPVYAIQGPTTSSTRIARLSAISRDSNYKIVSPVKEVTIPRKSKSSIYRCKGIFNDMGKC